MNRANSARSREGRNGKMAWLKRKVQMSLIISFIHKPSQMVSLHHMQLRLKVNPMSVLIATAIKSSILKQ